MKSDLDSLVPLDRAQCQAYFSNRLQISDIMDWVLGQVGPSHVMISTFSTSEEFIRKVHKLKENGMILSCSLFCDIRAARKTLNLYSFIKSVFDEVYLCENHSKVILFMNGKHAAVVISSQNQTRGNRYECGVISCLDDMTVLIKDSFEVLAQKSNQLNELL